MPPPAPGSSTALPAGPRPRPSAPRGAPWLPSPSFAAPRHAAPRPATADILRTNRVLWDNMTAQERADYVQRNGRLPAMSPPSVGGSLSVAGEQGQPNKGPPQVVTVAMLAPRPMVRGVAPSSVVQATKPMAAGAQGQQGNALPRAAPGLMRHGLASPRLPQAALAAPQERRVQELLDGAVAQPATARAAPPVLQPPTFVAPPELVQRNSVAV